MRTCCFLALTCGFALPVAGQQRILTGLVRTAAGEPVRGANVFVLETLDGAITDSIGRFRVSTRQTSPRTLVVQRIGLREARIAVGAAEHLTIELQPEAIQLPDLQVIAGRFRTGDSPDVELRSVDVVSTPGAAADVYRALQTFPGLQTVDGGAGLFVRGGDVAETKVFLNEAIVLSPYRYESPTGGFFGAFDPFLLSGIEFSTGGFGARYGNTLSGVAALRTVGRPERVSGGATVSLATLSGTAAVPLGAQLGVRGTFTRSHTGLMFRVNGTNSEFTHNPEGRDASFLGSWVYRSGEVRFFALDQWSQLGVSLDEPSFSGALNSHAVHTTQVLRWEHNRGATRSTVVVAHSGARNEIAFGNFDITTRDRLQQLRALLERPVSPWLGLTAGGELVERSARFTGRVPDAAFARDPAAPSDAIRSRIADRTVSGFIETDWTPAPSTRAILGARVDRSKLTSKTTIDPRASIAWQVTGGATVTAAWGVYHQVPDPQMHDPAFGGANLESMRAEHRIVGLQMGAGQALLRVEAFQKQYHDLAQLTRDRAVVAGGSGRTRGLDVFLRWPAWHGLQGRTSYSYIRARRTDPNTNTLAPSPFDITHVSTTVLAYAIGPGFQISVAGRYATGKPYTPVISARFDQTRQAWEPAYGKPNSQRVPAFQRVDVSLSRLVPLSSERLLVLFVSTNNIFDRKNIHEYTYNTDYTERSPRRSQFERSVYFGASLTF